MGAAVDRGDVAERKVVVLRLFLSSLDAFVLQEVVRQSVLTNQIPRAQAVLRRRSRPERRLSALRMEGLRQVFSCLQQRDLQTAATLLTNMVGTPAPPAGRLLALTFTSLLISCCMLQKQGEKS